MSRVQLRRFAPLISVGLLACALWLLHRELANHHPRDVLRAARALPFTTVLAALGLTAVSYAILPLYDGLGLRYVGRRLGVARTMMVGFLSYAFSQTLGFGLLTGGSLRYRLYSTWGLSGAEIAQVIAVSAVTLWLGITCAAGATLVASPESVVGALGFPLAMVRILGILSLAVPIGYLGFSLLRRRPIAVRGWELAPPRPRLAVMQIVVGCVDWVVAAAVAYVLLPSSLAASFGAFLGVFVLAQVVGLASHVPGGVGVFETVVILLLRGQAPPAAIAGSLIAYRVVYYVVPFTVAIVALVLYELRARRAAVARVARAAATWLPALAPRALAGITFVAGAVLVFSGSLPAEADRLAFLSDFVPLSVIEISHFAGSIVGVGLLVLAWGLARRLDAAFHAALVLLATGVTVSLLKGIDYEEAVVSGLALVSLLATRRRFNRRASILHEPVSAPWVVAIGTVLVAAVWLGLFAFRHVPYRSELWWQFALTGNAPRFLRATVGTFVVAAAFGLARLLRPTMPTPAVPTAADLDAVRGIVATAPRTYANLVFLGDKSVLVDEARSAFLMYGVSGRSWVTMGDPIGAENAVANLAWRFREIVHEHGGLTVFYQVLPESLPLYLDLGLRPLKLGEEARVPLTSFSLDGGSRKSLRRVRRHVERAGGTFGVMSPAEVLGAMGELSEISSAWLDAKRTREKAFSLGRFDPAYISQFPAAVVRVDGRLVAFANVWVSGGNAELSVDLMRYSPHAPDGAMEYLFIELMLWGAQQGYEWFNLGMAPLSGIEARALGPLWNRVNALLFRHGEHFYNFQGLRAYKEKFDPQWSPRYLAAPGGLVLPRVLADLSALISGGLMGVVAR